MLVEFLQQFFLLLCEFLWRLDQDLDVHVAVLTRAQHRHALAGKAEPPVRRLAYHYVRVRVVLASTPRAKRPRVTEPKPVATT